jgi:hypothetical protein
VGKQLPSTHGCSVRMELPWAVRCARPANLAMPAFGGSTANPHRADRLVIGRASQIRGAPHERQTGSALDATWVRVLQPVQNEMTSL